MKCRYTDNLYTDIIDEKAFQKKLKTLARKKPDPRIFLITYPISGHNLMEIYSEAEILQPYYRKQKKYLNIMGIASSRDAAKKLIPDILNDMMSECGSIDVKAFVKSHLSKADDLD